MALSIQLPGDFGTTGFATGAAKVRQDFVGSANRAFVLDASIRQSLFQDREGTTPVTAIGQPVRLIRDRTGQNRHAVLGAAMTGTPIWQGSYIDIPLNARFEIPNPIRMTDYTTVIAFRLTGVSSGGEFSLLSQDGPSASNFLTTHVARNNGNFGANILSTTGFELVGPAISLNTDYVGTVQKSQTGGTAFARINGGTNSTVTFVPPLNLSSDQPTTQLFGRAATVSGRLYYVAWVNRIVPSVQITALEAVAAARSGVLLTG